VQTVLVVRKTIRLEERRRRNSDESETSYKDSSFEDERRILSLLRSLEHPNILELLASYSVQTRLPTGGWSYKNHMLFPLANQGSLHQILRAKSGTKLNRIFNSTRSLFEQLYGLASAIEKLHDFQSPEFGFNLIGCHRDLRPKNIFVHEKRLVLADFGLSRLRAENSKSKFAVGDGDYLAPECETVDEDDFKAGTINRAADIWAFGCIILDLVTHLQSGYGEWAGFRESRKRTFLGFTVRLFHEHTHPSPEVTRQLKSLYPKLSTTESVSLDLITEMLEMNPDRRPKAATVATTLFTLSQRLVFDILEKAIEPFTELKEDWLSWKLEKERLRIWGDSAGLRQGKDKSVSSWLTESPHYFTKIAETLSSMERELLLLNSTLREGILLEFLPKVLPIKIRGMNDALWYLVPPEEVGRMTSILEDCMTQADDLETLLVIKNAFEFNPPYRNISTLAAMKNMKLKLEMKPANAEEGSYYTHMVPPPTKKRLHYFGKVPMEEEKEKEDVLIEYVSYNLEYYQRGDIESDEVFERVEKLADLLVAAAQHENFRILELHRYCHDISRASFGFMYLLPHGSSDSAVTLKEVIAKSTRPALGKLFELSHKIASAILQFHKVNGWVHKNISAHNIMFFSDRLFDLLFNRTRITEDQGQSMQTMLEPPKPLQHSKNEVKPPKKGFSNFMNVLSSGSIKNLKGSTASSSTTTMQGQLGSRAAPGRPGEFAPASPLPLFPPVPEQGLDNPYIVGFNHSRPDDQEAFTFGASTDRKQRLYHHPDYDTDREDGRFQLSYDYYSLGLVLLEIGLWEILEEITQREVLATLHPSAQRKHLVEVCVPRLGPAMGTNYQNAVRLCLGVGEIVLDRESFEEKVVWILGNCNA
jgi:serine/threonine protein kinase